MNNTKEKLLLAALRLFAREGYEAVSVSDIAEELKITKGAIYKHYKSKRDIFDNIVMRMSEQDAERALEYKLPEGTLADMPEEYKKVSVENLIEFSKTQFEYWTADSFASEFRKVLTLEQFRNDEMKMLYHGYFVDGPLGYVADILLSIGYDKAQEYALELYSPMFFLYSMYDSQTDSELVKKLADWHFRKIYIELMSKNI